MKSTLQTRSPRILDRSGLVRIFGFPATLVHFDTLVLDRWLWLKNRLPRTRNGERLIDIGTGAGAFAIGAARRGYTALGLSWDAENQRVATERSRICNAYNVTFDLLDVRRLDERKDLVASFEVAICLETIEHILDDRKLLIDIGRVLVPGGFLPLTTPNYYYRAITAGDEGPFLREETGWHVRRGYTPSMLFELCEVSGFMAPEISYCGGFCSQKVTWLLRNLDNFHWLLAWVVALPLRILPPLFDPLVRKILGWPDYSICIVAQKPRFRELK
jgi:SAM-dependent methyltransferase